MTTNFSRSKWSDAWLAAGLAADGAARILLKHFGQLRNLGEKEQAGLVSDADRESEAFIIAELRKKFPRHRFYGEETGLSAGTPSESSAGSPAEPTVTQDLSSGALWMIDPLDGTTNFVHQFPFFCISIALQVDGELVVGLVDAPLLGLRFEAIQGCGAFLNGKPIHVSGRALFREGLFATGFSCIDDCMSEQFALIEACVKDARGIRRAGSAALDLCYVAQGVFDCFWEKNLQPWDTAAGTLMVREAGGIVTDFDGSLYDVRRPHIIAGNLPLHGEMLSRIRRVRGR